jgi:tetratricopeptide (TPR) repeat protein
MNCPECTAEVKETWVACPLCGVRLDAVCTCGTRLDPAWKICPVCARSVIGQDPASHTECGEFEVPAERCFGIHFAAHNVFFGAFEDAFQKFTNAGAASELIHTVSHQSLKDKLASAVEGVCASYLSEPEMKDFAVAAIDSSRHSRGLEPYLSKVQAARHALAERDIPDGLMAQIWRGATTAIIDPAALTAGAVLPGIGHALGGLWSGIQMGKKDTELLNAFLDSIKEFQGQLDRVFFECYSELQESSRRKGIRFAVGFSEILESLEKLEELSAALDAAESKEEIARVATQVEAFVTKYPFSGKAHYLLASSFLSLDRFDQADHEAYTAFTLDNTNQLAIVVMLFARVAMERWDDAAQTAHFAVQISSGDLVLLESIGTALRRVPDPDLFGDTIHAIAPQLQEAGNALGHLLAARLHAQAGDSDHSADFLSKLMATAPLTIEEAIFLRKDTALGAARTQFDGVLKGFPNPMRIARAVLSGCDSLWFESIPNDKQAAAKASFVKLRRKERLVCYCDTTAFGGGKDGFALTDRGIMWHELWQDPVCIDYTDIEDFQIAYQGDELKLLTFISRDGSQLQYASAEPKAAMGIFNFLNLRAAATLAS